MFCNMLSLALLWVWFQQAYTSPIAQSSENLNSLSKRAVTGPKIDGANFPDPTIIYVEGDQWYSFATRTIGSSIHVQIASSPDFVTWSIVYNADGTQKDALPDLPAWVSTNPASSSNVWAPDVNLLDDGSFIIYYSASTVTDPTKHCVGAATSRNIVGPYTAQPEALFCPLSKGGAIDASGYRDPADGRRYVVYKVDGNSLGKGGACGNTVPPLVDTPLVLQPVAADGYTFTGNATTLLDHNDLAENAEGTDDGIVEAPVIVKDGSIYFLFFSPGCFTTTNYRVAYATATSITGPYTRSPTPLLKSGDIGLSGPGGADISKRDGFLVFHANYENGRALYTARVTFDGTTASVGS